ncbi:hypothetical protein BKA65DRAFT_505517 [Rhexocercosporidium sp. MPI-PUGE-AT-0058]|nr:hypothetical protein BKA65DRAFT_505517 [Rhexocercosporidium sp. MPI-PUGE-AT-0058]
MSSPTPSKATRDAQLCAYHSKINRMLQNLERDLTALEVQFRTGLAYAYPSPSTSTTAARIPATPHLPSPPQFSPIEAMGKQFKSPMPNTYTPSIPTMPSMYIASSPLQSEMSKKVAREARMKFVSEKRDEGLGLEPGEVDVDVGIGGEDEEVYDPANPLIGQGSKASKLYDFERYRRSMEADIGLGVEYEASAGSEVQDQRTEMEIDRDEKEYKTVPRLESYQVSIETTHPAKEQQREMIEKDSPDNLASEKFWAQLFSEESKTTSEGMGMESVEQPNKRLRDRLNAQEHDVETLSNQAYSPFEQSPAPEIPSPFTDHLEHEECTDSSHLKAQKKPNTKEIENPENPSPQNHYNDLFTNPEIHDDVFTEPHRENVFWDRNSDPTDFEREDAMHALEDEYAAMHNQQDEYAGMSYDDEEEEEFVDSE